MKVMAKDKWKTVYRGVRVKYHSSRKNGVKPDQYFAVRFQFNGETINSGLGWATEGWTQEKAIVKLNQLKTKAKEGKGVKSHRNRNIEEDEERKKKEQEQKKTKKFELKKTITLRSYFEDVYFPYVEEFSRNKPKTIKSEEQLFRVWIDPIIGNKKFIDIYSFDIQRLKKKLLDAGRSARTLEYVYIIIGKIYKYANETGHHVGNPPINKDHKVKYDNRRIRFLTQQDAHTLLNEIKTKSQQLYEMSMISLHCGLRADEVFKLKWKDLDLDNSLINLLDTKNTKSRTLSMTEDVKKIFNEKKNKLNGELIFTDKYGKKIQMISKTFSRSVKKIGLNIGYEDRREFVSFHTLRHTYASWLVQQGTPLYTVQKLMGHSSIAMTERYSHLAPDNTLKTAGVIDKVFNDQSTQKKISTI